MSTESPTTCPNCGAGLHEGYSTIRCSRCGFRALKNDSPTTLPACPFCGAVPVYQGIDDQCWDIEHVKLCFFVGPRQPSVIAPFDAEAWSRRTASVGAPVSPWISVEIRLPPKDRPVMAWSARPNEHHHATTVDFQGINMSLDYCRYAGWTHWMPIDDPNSARWPAASPSDAAGIVAEMTREALKAKSRAHTDERIVFYDAQVAALCEAERRIRAKKD